MMKRFILAALFLIAGSTVVAGSAHASEPLTEVHSGHYYDPSASGQGVELHVYSGVRVLGTLFLGSVPGWYAQPIWLSGQGRVDQDSIPLYQSYGVVFGESNPIGLVPVGHVVLDVVGDCSTGQHCIDATITIDGSGFVQFSPAPSPITHTLRLRRLL